MLSAKSCTYLKLTEKKTYILQLLKVVPDKSFRIGVLADNKGFIFFLYIKHFLAINDINVLIVLSIKNDMPLYVRGVHEQGAVINVVIKQMIPNQSPKFIG